MRIQGHSITILQTTIFILSMLLLATSAGAQTRFFQPGDSGLSSRLDLTFNDNTLFEQGLSLRVAYTYAGFLDIGIANDLQDFEADFLEKGKRYFLNVAVWQPESEPGWGLELNGHLATQSRTLEIYHDTYLGREETYAGLHTGARAYYRDSSFHDSNIVAGLSAFYRSNRNRILGPEEEVLYERKHGEMGLALDLHMLVSGAVHCSLLMEYSEHSPYPDRKNWELVNIFALGVFFGLD